MNPFLLAPSILAADFGKLNEEIDMINRSQCDWLHVDVMDGVFVPNISFGQMLVSTMKTQCQKHMDVHLMIVNPDRYIESFVEAGADSLSFHLEATHHAHRVVAQIKENGARAGVAINPQTPVENVFDILEDLDFICLMSVNPGFGGQKFIYRSLDKIRRLKEEITNRNLPVKIEVDGGVGLHNAEKILQAGADILVAGSSVFKSDDPLKTIDRFKQLAVNNYNI